MNTSSTEFENMQNETEHESTEKSQNQIHTNSVNSIRFIPENETLSKPEQLTECVPCQKSVDSSNSHVAIKENSLDNQKESIYAKQQEKSINTPITNVASNGIFPQQATNVINTEFIQMQASVPSWTNNVTPFMAEYKLEN